jgi:hypothetical protein
VVKRCRLCQQNHGVGHVWPKAYSSMANNEKMKRSAAQSKKEISKQKAAEVSCKLGGMEHERLKPTPLFVFPSLWLANTPHKAHGTAWWLEQLE